MNIETGQNGENIAVDFLKKSGYKIIFTNWRYAHYEVDIVAKEGDTLVIVEVKTRASDSFGHPSQFVNLKKHQNLFKAAEELILKINHQGEVRFDIISVFKTDNHWVTEHFADAFYPC
ncbi:MAG: YraN family protein [Chitinophagales bacterium]|nr:YraN family protein [Chitinophagales bacterium]MCZ2394295.1 YraN family protein [Chitinophagales bacterium]